MSQRERSRCPLLLAATVLLAGCGAAGQADAPDAHATVAATTKPDHADLIGKVYDIEYSTPAGFFVDDRATTQESYTIHHVKDASVSYELCTDDFYEAQAWEADDNERRAVNGHFVNSHETPLYFEFVRELTYPDDVGNVQGETSLGFARVFKCAAVNRNGVDRHLRDGYGGTMNARPLTDASVRDLTEYLWQFEYFHARSKKVLRSMGMESDDFISQTLQLAFLYNQGNEICDRIEVIDWTYSADKRSGEISRQFLFQYAIQARIVNGTPETCTS